MDAQTSHFVYILYDSKEFFKGTGVSDEEVGSRQGGVITSKARGSVV